MQPFRFDTSRLLGFRLESQTGAKHGAKLGGKGTTRPIGPVTVKYGAKLGSKGQG